MKPVAIVVGLLGLAIAVVRGGGLLIAPEATAAFRRRLFATPGRVRILSLGLLLLIAAPLIVTARQARGGSGVDGTHWVEALGWFAVVVTLLALAFPRRLQELNDAVYDVAKPAALRFVGAWHLSFGLFLIYLAVAVL